MHNLIQRARSKEERRGEERKGEERYTCIRKYVQDNTDNFYTTKCQPKPKLCEIMLSYKSKNRTEFIQRERVHSERERERERVHSERENERERERERDARGQMAGRKKCYQVKKNAVKSNKMLS